jgi:Zn-dependent metalloprotease
MKARTLILLGVVAALALLVVPALALSPLAAATEAAPAVSVSKAPVVKPVAVGAPTTTAAPIDPDGLARLEVATDGTLQISFNRATGTVRFIQVSPSQPDALSSLFSEASTPEAQADAFWAEYGSLFGIDDPAAQLQFVRSRTDAVGTTRLEYRQVYEGVPVFAGILFVHFSQQGQMTAVNGVSVPDITVNSQPSLTAEQAAQIAIDAVGPTGMRAAKNTLYVYRTGLAQGVKGQNYLAYEVEVTNGVNVRDFVIVDAHTGKIIDRWSAIENALIREVYSGTFTAPALVWKEGDSFPYTGVFSEDINNLIYGGGETYNLFASAFGRDSYDAAGAIMRTVNNDPTISCPNANWNGITTNYCNGVTGDDTVAHEWGHAYTEYTHNLIYAWQPGALNESYSDIWGEVVDLLNGRGTDTPGGLRTDGLCSVYTSPAPVLQINAPAAIVGNYPAAASSFGPSLITPTNWVTNTVVLVNDGVGRDGSITPPVNGTDATTSDGCTPYVNAAAVAGKIALIDRGTCSFQIKANNANAAGAAGFIVANHQAGGNGLINMAGTGGTAPGVFTGHSTGLTIRSQLTNTVNATLKSTAGLADDSYRWLSGEDDPAFGESIRDMWSPNCYNDPARVTDAYYQCDASDGGGVHTNSGVPNHTFALLVDGGSFNGYTVTGIGLTKAAHLYWRAQDIYQTPTTDFYDHADALTASCNDLVLAGTNLSTLSTSISTTVGSGQVFTTTDCLQVTRAISATELRTPPAQCNFQPLLNPATPALCAPGTGSAVSFYTDTFEVASGWTVTHTDVFSPTNYDWVRRGSLPSGRPGQAFFGVNEVPGASCNSSIGDVSRVMYLTSPVINVPTTTTALRLAFDHWVATEAGYDGGNVWISVNGGAWQLVAPGDYTFNPYNSNITLSGNTNPLAGLPGFTGSDGGQVTGSWGTSLIDLHGYAVPGDSFQLRYALGTDGCGGLEGWYVDDVEAYYCSADLFGEINVVESSVSSQQMPGTVVTETLTIENGGSGDLVWDILEMAASGFRMSKPQVANPDVVEALQLDRKPAVPAVLNAAKLALPNVPDAANLVLDPSFEAGSPNPYWDEFSAAFGTPLCNPSCGAAGALTGDWWVWFGGAGPNAAENGFVSQAITITPGLATLEFWMVMGAPGGGTGNFTVTVDSTVVFTANHTMTPTYGNDYTLVSLDVSAFADGQAHVVTLAESDPATPGNFNVFVDDVSLTVIDCIVTDLPWLSVSPSSGTTGAYTSTTVSVVFNANVPSGTYNGQLCVASNDLVNPVIKVPVTMTVVPTAQLAVAHLAPFANTLAGTSVTVTVDSAPVLTDFQYGDSTGYLTVAAGPHLVEIFPAGSATPAITGNVVLSTNLSYSAVAIGDGVNQPLGLLALLDDTTPVSGSVKIRIGHVAPFASGAALADVRLQDGTPIITNVPYSLVSPYLTLPAGLYDLKITAPGGSPTLIDPLPVTLNSNDILSVFATGDGVQQKLGVFAWPSNQAGFFLPLMKYLYLPLILR